MAEKIKILMLGDSTSGKTCFMLGMYAAILDGSTFSLKATDPDEGIRLTALWSAIVDTSGNERWPPTTDKPQTYNFELCYAYKPLMEFEWLDYRGGSMLDLSSDVRTLRDYAAESNGFFFCISGKYLKEPVTEANLQKVAMESKANLMGKYLEYLSINNRRQTRKKTFPIVIIVTQYDYCYDDNRNKRELMEDVKKMFPPLFATDSDWLVMICPITLGKDLATDSENGKIEPKNLEIPVAFVLYCILTEQARIQDEKLTEIDDQLEVLESNLFNRWINRRKIRRLNESLRQAEMQLQKTIEMINVLAREQEDLSSTDIYLSGKKIQIDLDLS